MQYYHNHGEELEELIIKIAKDKKLLHEFLFDLLTPQEYTDLAVRWQIVKLLKMKVPQRMIVERLKVSMATVSRGSRELLNQKGGFNEAYKRYYP